MPTITMRLSQDDYDRLKNYAKIKGLSLSEFLREAILALRVRDMTYAMINWQDMTRTSVAKEFENCMKSCWEKLSQSEDFKARAKSELLPLVDRTALMDPVLDRSTGVKKRRGRPSKKDKSQAGTSAG